MDKKLIVIGGDAAGMSSALVRLKGCSLPGRLLFSKKLIIYLMLLCGMPYLSRLIPDKEELIELTPEVAIKEKGKDRFKAQARSGQDNPARQKSNC